MKSIVIETESAPGTAVDHYGIVKHSTLEEVLPAVVISLASEELERFRKLNVCDHRLVKWEPQSDVAYYQLRCKMCGYLFDDKCFIPVDFDVFDRFSA